MTQVTETPVLQDEDIRTVWRRGSHRMKALDDPDSADPDSDAADPDSDAVDSDADDGDSDAADVADDSTDSDSTDT